MVSLEVAWLVEPVVVELLAVFAVVMVEPLIGVVARIVIRKSFICT